VRAAIDAYEWITLNGNTGIVQALQHPDLPEGYRRIVLPDVDAWSVRLLSPV
jgi:hypothetical protein